MERRYLLRIRLNKNKKVIICIASLLCLTSCRLFERNAIYFENKSDKPIDSLIITAIDYPIKLYNIESAMTSVKEVDASKIKRGRDFALSPTFYLKDTVLHGEGFYMSGGFSGTYKITLDKDMKVKWSMVSEYE